MISIAMRILVSIIVLAAHAFAQTGPIAGPVYGIGNGVSQPKLIYKIEPAYSEEARQAKWQGNVGLSIVVGEDGSPSEIKVSHSLGLGLDENAIEAVKQWRFQPGLKDGKPVRVIASIEVRFRLDDPPQTGPSPQIVLPDPAKRIAVEELLILTKADQLLPQMLELVRAPTQKLIEAGIDKGLPSTIDRKLIAPDAQDLEKQIFEAITARLKAQFAPMFISVYSDTFTLDELQDLVSFYKTPSGQALTRKQPELIKKTSAAMQALTLQPNPEMQKLIRDWTEAMNKKYGTP
jgi:TonB family protein